MRMSREVSMLMRAKDIPNARQAHPRIHTTEIIMLFHRADGNYFLFYCQIG